MRQNQTWAYSWFVIHTRTDDTFNVLPSVAGIDQFLECMEDHLASGQLVNAYDGYKRLERPFPPLPRRLPLPRESKSWKRAKPGIVRKAEQ